MKTKALKRELLRSRKSRPIPAEDYLNSGSTLLNLACSGMPRACYAKGHYYLLRGDSNSGKTWVSWNLLAEATLNTRFNQYALVHDDPEGGSLMDVRRYFGSRVADRVQLPPGGTSATIQDFYFNLADLMDGDTPFIYILDSIDALDSEEDEAKFQEQRAGRKNGKTTTGTYGVAKAKANSTMLRRVVSRLKRTGSILLVINQTRDNLSPFGFETKSHAGGRSLKFYAGLEIWSSVKGQRKVTVRGKPRQVGIDCKLQVKKNRLRGRDRTVVIPIYHSIGFDDVGACIDYLLEERHWKKRGSKITAPEFDFTGKRSRLIQHVESEDLEGELQNTVAKVWNEIEAACAVKRKPRYA